MLAYRKWTALLVAALSLWLGQVHAEERPEVADQVIAYTGAQGAKVWTLRIGERAANEALVQIEGVDHDWNMRIQKMQVENQQGYPLLHHRGWQEIRCADHPG